MFPDTDLTLKLNRKRKWKSWKQKSKGTSIAADIGTKANNLSPLITNKIVLITEFLFINQP